MIDKIKRKVNKVSTKVYTRFKSLTYNNIGRVGSDEIIGVAAVLIIAGFVLIPGLRNFSDNIMTNMNNWWTNIISDRIFPTS